MAKKIKKDSLGIEVWKKIKGYEGHYEVSNLGSESIKRIVNIVNGQSKKRTVLERTLKGGIVPNGYKTVGLSRKTFYVHILVANSHLVKPRIKNAQVNHINGVKTDNRAINLEWITASDNRKHAFRIGIQKLPKGESNAMCKFKDSEIKRMRKLYSKGTDRKVIARKYNISLPRLCDILNYKYRI